MKCDKIAIIVIFSKNGGICMNFNRNKHCSFVQQLDRTAEKSPLLWLPCVLLIALALVGEHIFEHARIAYRYRNTEKVIKEKPQGEKKPFVMRAAAVTLAATFSLMTVQQLDLIGIDVFAEEIVNAETDGAGDENVDNTVGTDIVQNEQTGGNSDVLNDGTGEGSSEIETTDEENADTTVDTDILQNEQTGENGDGLNDGTGKVPTEIEGENTTLEGITDSISNAVTSDEGINALMPLEDYSPEITVNLSNSEIRDYNGHSYQVFSNVVETWEEAKAYCEKMGGHLVVINDNAENTAVYNIMVEMGYSDAYFGYADVNANGNWSWIEGYSSDYTNWAPNEPNHENSNENYAMFYHKYKYTWNDGNFETYYQDPQKNFICEWENIYFDEQSGKCGENAYWKLSADGTLTISGFGKVETEYGARNEHMSDYHAPWYDLNSRIKKIVISEGITELGESAFYMCGAESIDLPDTLTVVGDHAFCNCHNLTNITVPSEVNYIGVYAFNMCVNLKNLTIPYGVTEIKKGAFENCNVLEKLVIPSSVSYINSSETFDNCRALVIYGNKGSYAEKYANKHNIPFVAIDSDEFIDFRSDRIKVPYLGEFTEQIRYKGTDDIVDFDYKIDDESIIKITKTEISNKFEFPGSDWEDGRSDPVDNPFNTNRVVAVTIQGLKQGSTKLTVTINNEHTAVIDVDVYIKKESNFEIKKDNFQFSNSTDDFCENFLGLHFDTYDMSTENLLKLLSYVSEPSDKQYLIDKRKKHWTGSCFGMSAIMTEFYLDKTSLPLNQFFGDKTGDKSLYELSENRKPVNDDSMKNIVNYYHLTQHLPGLKRISDANFDSCNIDYTLYIYQIINNVRKHPVIAMIRDLKDKDPNKIRADHAIVLLDIESEDSGHCSIRCCDPVYKNEETFLDIYFNSEGKASEIVYNYEHQYNFIYGYYNVSDIKKYNYFDTSMNVDKETYDSNILLLYKNRLFSDEGYLLANGLLVQPAAPPSRDGIKGPFTSCNTLADGNTNGLSYEYHIPRIGITEYELKDIIGEMEFLLDNYYFKTDIASTADIKMSDSSGNINVVSDKINDLKVQITSNNYFNGGKWFTFGIETDNASKLELTPKDKGIVINGDNLKTTKVTANDETEDTTLEFSTEEDSVFLVTDEENNLEAYIDTDDDGIYETPLTKSCTITIPEYVTVTRNGQPLKNGDKINNGDVIKIIADIHEGYSLKSLTVNGMKIENGSAYTVGNGNIVIEVEYTNDNVHTHDLFSTYSSDKTGHWYACSKCDEKVDFATHTEDDGTVTVLPTATISGTKTYSCSVCGYVMRTVTLSDYKPFPSTPTYPVVSPVSITSENEIEVTLESDLSGISAGKVHLSTKKRFFKNSAVVTVTNTETANNAASMAISYLSGGAEHNIIYPFDISIYNADTHEEMQLKERGYITFEIPVPDILSNKIDDIGVYHIVDGKPEVIKSRIVEKGGVNKIRFTADSYSPYMFAAYSENGMEDVSSRAGVTVNDIPIDFAGPTTNGVGIPTARLPQIMKFSNKKRKYRILRKRRLDDVVFVL